MERIKKKTAGISVVKLIFGMSPVYAVLHFLFATVEALVSSGFLALAIANFVDTALLILEGEREKSGLYANLVLLLIVLGLFSTMGSMIRLVDARIRLDVNKKVKPFLVCTQAKVAFKHIENDKSWELMSRVLRDPAPALVDGVIDIPCLGSCFGHCGFFRAIVLLVCQGRKKKLQGRTKCGDI